MFFYYISPRRNKDKDGQETQKRASVVCRNVNRRHEDVTKTGPPLGHSPQP